MKIETIIAKNQDKTILFLGRVPHFTPQELQNFLSDQGMKYAKRYREEEDIALLVLSSMMTPLEEQISYNLYNLGIPDITLSEFESYYAQHIKPNTLLMSLKLSNDQARLRRLLQNEAFSDEVYLKLFRIFDWQDDGIHESDANRDVTITFVRRFYSPDGFRDPAMVYSPATVMNIAQESSDPEVLDAILTMPNHEIKVSRYEIKRPKNLRERVAFNEAVSQKSIKHLMGYHNPSIDYFLAANSALSPTTQRELYGRLDHEGKFMLAHNRNLTDDLFEAMLEEGDEIIKRLLRYQPMSLYRLELVMDEPLILYLGQNREIEDFVDILLELDNRELDFQLATNEAVKLERLEMLYYKYGTDIIPLLVTNPNLSNRLFEEFYHYGDIDTTHALALNRSTPKEILSELCERNDRELNRLLASNPSVDIKYLRAFQLDPSLVRILADNETYGKSVLQGLGL